MANSTYATSNDLLADCQDLVVLGRTNTDRHVYGLKASLAAQKVLFADSVADKSEREILAFQSHWNYDEKIGITGSSTELGLRFDKRALRSRGMWIPGLLEAKAIEAQGRLENKVYRDYGTTVSSNSNPNEKRAEELTKQASELGLELPLIVPFRAQDYVLNLMGTNGLFVSIVSSPQGIISGEKSVRELAKLNLKGNSGVHRLARDSDCYWYANWSDLVSSFASGRVDWICGEATAQNLVDAHATLLERKYDKSMREEREAFERALGI